MRRPPLPPPARRCGPAPHPAGWAATVRDALREAHTAVESAKTAGQDRLDPALLADLRARYDKAVAWGQATNRHRDRPNDNHPGKHTRPPAGRQSRPDLAVHHKILRAWNNNAA